VAILDTVAISHDVVGVSCEELGWHVNSCLLPTALPPRLLYYGAIKLMVAPVRNLHPLVGSPIVSPSPSLRVKRER
jgi:hypothetical protein